MTMFEPKLKVFETPSLSKPNWQFEVRLQRGNGTKINVVQRFRDQMA